MKHSKESTSTSTKSTQKTKILFLCPPNITFEDFTDPPKNITTITKNNGKQFGNVITDMPLGVVSLSAYLKKHLNIETMAVDFNVTLNQAKEFEFKNFYSYYKSFLDTKKYKEFNPDYVAISATFISAYLSALDLTKLSKKLFPNAYILVGGNTSTTMYKNILNDSPFIDGVCYGEGERPLKELLDATDKREFLNNHSSWVTHKNIKDNISSFKHDFIDELDEIPFLDYDMLDVEGYKINPTATRYSVSDNTMAKSNGGNGKILEENIGKSNENNGKILEEYSGKHVNDEEYSSKETNDVGKTNLYAMPIMTSRGCPFRCTFCAAHATHGRKMRYHSVERVVNDLKLMKEKYNINGVVVQDDHFMGREGGRDRPYDVVSGIHSLNLDMFFQNALAMYALVPKFLNLLKKSGVNELVLPIESGSSRVLKEIMRKPLKLNIIKEVAKNCRDAGIYTDCNIVLGMPGETKEDIDECRKSLKSLYTDWFRIFIYTPLPGSEAYETCETNDYFDKKNLTTANYKRAVVQTEHMTSEYVQYMSYFMNIELNFVYNSNIRLKNYKNALESFLKVLKVKSDHALAHYYAGYCYEMMDKFSKAAQHYAKAEVLTTETDFWDVFIQEFNIPINNKAEKYMKYSTPDSLQLKNLAL